jgi:hypothetical protein
MPPGEERDETEAQARAKLPLAKDRGSGRSLFRSSKLYLLTALTTISTQTGSIIYAKSRLSRCEMFAETDLPCVAR